MTAGLPELSSTSQASRWLSVVADDENILSEHHLQFDLYSRKFENVDDPSQMHGDPLKQIADRCQLQPATTSKVGRRDMRTRLYHKQVLRF